MGRKPGILLIPEQRNRLRVTMLELGLSLQKLASNSGISTKTISDIYNNEEKPFSADTITSVVNALNQKADNLNQEAGSVKYQKLNLNDFLLPVGSPNDTIPVPIHQRQSESSTASHLVIATFFDEISSDDKDKYQVDSKIFYPDLNLDPVSLGSDVVTIDKLSLLIDKKIEEAEKELAKKFDAINDPWDDPIIRLFIPLELMSLPLKTWLKSQLHEYPLIIGCSDRYDSEHENYPKWINKYRKGWKKLEEHLSTLNQLKWTDTMLPNPDDLAEYSGFRCRGNYLKSGEKYLEYWRILVASGIPLALWGCEPIISPNTTDTIFDRLTNHDHFEILQQIPKLRQECYRSNHDYFGVFYEHPRYRPSIDRALRQSGET